MSQSRWMIIGPALVFVMICGVGVYLGMSPQDGDAAASADDESEEKSDAKPAPEETTDSRPGPDASTADLVKALAELRDTELTAETQAEAIKQLNERIEAMIHLSDRILKAEDADDEQTTAALMGKVSSYYTLSSVLGDETAMKKAIALAKTYTQDEREKVALLAKQIFQELRIGGFAQLSLEERSEVVDELFAEIGDDEPSRFNVGPLFQLTSQLDGGVPAGEGAAILNRIVELCKTSKDEQVIALIARLEGVVRRLELPGNTMEISGTTLDGRKFDWDSYRGKVVLVDFWATWCGPCIQELPNVIANYKKYHDKGFEVVAINLDDDPETVQAFLQQREIPWVNLFPPAEEDRGWNNPIAGYYGIQGIPTAILVDREGKAVSLNARGAALGQMLEDLLVPQSE